MKYMGSKKRIAKYIIPIMVDIADKNGYTKWVEPFVGGANLIDKVPSRFDRIGYDINEHVIYALQDIRDRPDKLPEFVTEYEYTSILGTKPGPITSWIRFECSFGSKFEGGYARSKDGKNYAGIGFRSAKRQSPLLQGIEFKHSDYRDLSFKESIIYCDPPYQGSSGYKTGDFDHEEFFEWCREQAKRNIVFVSEYDAPFTELWRGEIKTNFSSSRKRATHNAVEKLFIV